MKRFVRRVFFLFLFSAIATAGGVEGQTYFFLHLQNEGGEDILTLPLRAREPFFIEYIHSSDGTPVRDTFEISEIGHLILIEEAFLWYGAGLEFQSHPGTQVVFDGKWSRVRLNRVLPELPIRVGRIAEQRLTLGNQSIRFDRLVKAGETLVLRVKTEGNRR